MENSSDIAEVLRRNAPRLMSIPHVIGVDVGPKIVGLRETDQLSIRVKVAVKLPKELLPSKYILPISIEGYPVDIVEERSDFANTVLRSAAYDQLSRDSVQRSLDQSKSLETSDLADHFRGYVHLLLRGWLAVTILTSSLALLFIVIGIWCVITRSVVFTAVSGGITLTDLVAMGVLKPWQKYQRAVLDQTVIEKATGVLNAQLEGLRGSDKPIKEVNQLRSEYLASWIKSVDRQ